MYTKIDSCCQTISTVIFDYLFLKKGILYSKNSQFVSSSEGITSGKNRSNQTDSIMDQPRELEGNEQDFESPSSNPESENVLTPRSQTRSNLMNVGPGPSAVDPERTRHRKQQNPCRLRRTNLRELRALLNRTDHMIPKLPFGRVIRELLCFHSRYANRISSSALYALQEASEAYITQMFQDSYACTIHRNRKTLSVRDMELVRFLRGGL